MSAQNEATERRVPCEVYSRIVGYLRPIRNWNIGKRQEFKEREEFNVAFLEESDDRAGAALHRRGRNDARR